jgi:hypothetical protein
LIVNEEYGLVFLIDEKLEIGDLTQVGVSSIIIVFGLIDPGESVPVRF